MVVNMTALKVLAAILLILVLFALLIALIGVDPVQ